MKKLYTTKQYKEWHKRKLKSLAVKQRRDKRTYDSTKGTTGITSFKGDNSILPPIIAPEDFRLIDNPEKCCQFFRDIRNTDNHRKSRINNGRSFVSMTLKYVKEIDYATISTLIAISDDFKARKIILRGDFPDETSPREFLSKSGFLDHMYDNNNKRYQTGGKSDMIFFEKGVGKLSREDNIKIGTMVKKVVHHLSGLNQHFNPVKTILLEICGNSIEHAYISKNKNWLLGIKYEEDRVIFTVTDIGKGILETLRKKFGHKLFDILSMKSEDEVLIGAFNKKYGSSTEEVNRNKGLPSIKHNFEQQTIRNLKVITNNVILHFDKMKDSKTFLRGSARFKGTFYQWELTNDCLERTQ